MARQRTDPLSPLPYMNIGGVGVGWRRRRETYLSLHELDSQGTVFYFLVWAVTTAGGQVRYVCAGRTFTPHKGDDRIR